MSELAGCPRSRLLENPRTRFFIITSNVGDNVVKSVENKVWATQRKNEDKLDDAFKSSRTVILIFSVNKSAAFQGYARMRSCIGQSICRTDPFGGFFGRLFDVEWLRLADLDFDDVKHLQIGDNSRRGVTAKDGQELDHRVGSELCRMMDLIVYKEDPEAYEPLSDSEPDPLPARDATLVDPPSSVVRDSRDSRRGQQERSLQHHQVPGMAGVHPAHLAVPPRPGYPVAHHHPVLLHPSVHAPHHPHPGAPPHYPPPPSHYLHHPHPPPHYSHLPPPYNHPPPSSYAAPLARPPSHHPHHAHLPPPSSQPPPPAGYSVSPPLPHHHHQPHPQHPPAIPTSPFDAVPSDSAASPPPHPHYAGSPLPYGVALGDQSSLVAAGLVDRKRRRKESSSSSYYYSSSESSVEEKAEDETGKKSKKKGKDEKKKAKKDKAAKKEKKESKAKKEKKQKKEKKAKKEEQKEAEKEQETPQEPAKEKDVEKEKVKKRRRKRPKSMAVDFAKMSYEDYAKWWQAMHSPAGAPAPTAGGGDAHGQETAQSSMPDPVAKPQESSQGNAIGQAGESKARSTTRTPVIVLVDSDGSAG